MSVARGGCSAGRSRLPWAISCLLPLVIFPISGMMRMEGTDGAASTLIPNASLGIMFP